MTITEAQQEMDAVYLGGSIGQIVSGAIWLISAGLATWAGTRPAMLALVFGGMLIFPLTQATLRLLGRRASVNPDNALRYLAMQVAFIVPLCLPLIGAATLYRSAWFYPSFMLVVGVHYLPFIFLYGSWHYGVLAGLLIGGGVSLGLAGSQSFTAGGWFTAGVLVVFGILKLFHRRPELPPR